MKDGRKVKGYKLYLSNNYIRSGIIKINAVLIKNNLYKKQGQGILERVNLFRSLYNLPPLGKKTYREWLVKTWEKNDHPILKRNVDDNFYFSSNWLSIRRLVLKKYGKICMKCSSKDFIAVDHIKPRSLYPELELDFNNLQVLCIRCNSSKSNIKIFDLRPLTSKNLTA